MYHSREYGNFKNAFFYNNLNVGTNGALMGGPMLFVDGHDPCRRFAKFPVNFKIA